MTRTRTSVTSGAAAFGVVVLVVLGWWLLSGNGPQGPDGSAQRLSPPTATTGGGSDSRVAQPPPAPKGAVTIQGFVVEHGSTLALNYTGLPRCAGRLATPTVVETDAAVTVTLRREPPAHPSRPCPALARLATVRVQLEGPLGDRAVVDGSYSQPVMVEPATRAWQAR